MLKELETELKSKVKFLPKPLKEYTVDELMDCLCEARDTDDELEIDTYLAGVMLNYKKYIIKLYTEHHNALKLDIGDFISWMYGAIWMATEPKNRKWQGENAKSHAGTVIIQILETRFKAAAYYESNLQKNKVNYETISLDKPVDEDAYTTISAVDLIESDLPTPSAQFNSANCIIQSLLDSNKLIEAIIAETIAYNDCTATETREVEANENGHCVKKKISYNVFKPRKVVALLNTLPEDYEEQFLDKFNVDPKKLEKSINVIKVSSNATLKDYLKTTQKLLGTFIV